MFFLTRREDIIEYLCSNPASAKVLSVHFDVPIKEIEIDLEHIRKSVRRMKKKLLVAPAHCVSCDYQFGSKKVKLPKKCPECHGQRIQARMFKIE